MPVRLFDGCHVLFSWRNRTELTRWLRNDRKGEMEILVWLILATIVLAIIYGSMNVGKRKESAGRESPKFDVTPDQRHGIDLQARRKPYDDVT